MAFSDLFKSSQSDFVVIDSQFPQKQPLGFRNVEINEYLRQIKNCQVYAMYPMQPGPDAWFSHGYGVEKQQFIENKQGYGAHYPHYLKRIHLLEEGKQYSAKLAYSFFLAETYVLLPFLEANAMPFVFVLYPGGGFGLNNAKSDAMLKRLLTSQCFRGVIATQPITNQYLLDKEYCKPEQITYIYGGFAQFSPQDVIQKKQYPHDKPTFDICFVAAKYSEKGVDKGYDLFIATAKQLAKTTADIRFHVIGGFDEHDIDVSELADRIIFYGFKQPDELLRIYSGMDVFLTPNRPGKLFDGNFDGFPLNIDAGYCGVALFASDELKLNEYYTPDEDIVIVPLDAAAITKSILKYYANPAQLYELSARGERITQRLFGANRQANERIALFKQHVDLIME